MQACTAAFSAHSNLRYDDNKYANGTTICTYLLGANLWEHKLTSEMIYTALLSLKLCIGSVSKRGEIAKNEKMHQDKKLLIKKKKKPLPVPTLKYGKKVDVSQWYNLLTGWVR